MCMGAVPRVRGIAKTFLPAGWPRGLFLEARYEGRKQAYLFYLRVLSSDGSGFDMSYVGGEGGGW